MVIDLANEGKISWAICAGVGLEPLYVLSYTEKIVTLEEFLHRKHVFILDSSLTSLFFRNR